MPFICSTSRTSIMLFSLSSTIRMVLLMLPPVLDGKGSCQPAPDGGHEIGIGRLGKMAENKHWRAFPADLAVLLCGSLS
ncbi:MAG: hypothetical protein A3H91_12465 [Gammaproteobacteria bacterium RIFCSPLOWO2_02_FULL_61_13]|nr:MAG: hypothetical protein A3H91_12465 [Gammaproteobacteria bacterium RIFCSPLOWO2_02_FULL_61_13]